MPRAVKIALGHLTLEELAKQYPGRYSVRVKDHPPKGTRLIIQLTPRGKSK